MRIQNISILLLVLFVSACAGNSGHNQEAEYHPVPGRSQLPFSEAVRVGSMLYLAGQIGTRSMEGDVSKIELVPGGIKAETRQTLENIRAVLERHGSSMDRVVKCLVMLADMKEWGEMNSVYVTYFDENLPARSALGANGLAMEARVEIECMATVQP